MNHDSRVLVTGGAGFIGSHLVRRALQEGKAVRVLDNCITGKMENLQEVQSGIEFLDGDVSDPEVARRAVQDVDCVFHQAAIPSVPRSVREPVMTHGANITGTVVMLDAAREAGVRRFVYAASSSAYGDAEASPKVETLPVNPLSPYAAAKLAGEHYCQSFHHVYGLETVALRYFNVFGPRQDPTSEYSAVIPRFISAMLDGGEITIYGDGEQSRDFTYIDNVVQANWRAMEASQAGGSVCNIARGESFTLNELAQTLGEIIGVTPQVRYQEARAGDVRHSLADIARARQVLGYNPEVGWREGLEKTVAWFKAERN